MIEDPGQKIGRPRQLYTGADAPRLSADLARANTARSECRNAKGRAAQAFCLFAWISARALRAIGPGHVSRRPR